jgi:hypothetical protein
MTVQTTVPSNLVPTRITQLPEYQGLSTAGYFPYVIDGVTYKVQFSNIAAVGAVPSSRTITGGGGLTGGGDLSADRVISIAAGGVGFSQLADSGVVAGTYGDPANIPVLTVDAKGRVTIASTTPINLGGYVPTSRSILAGAGLTGGGTLAADRTISLTLSTATPQSGGAPSAGTTTVAAREDHVHPAVDLSDATETSGVLPMSRGGTGSSLSPVAGAILYSDGSNLDLSNPGTAGQVFFSQGTAAPIFRSLTGGTTGLSFGLAGSAYALSGTLAIASGGTNATTVPAARVNLLPNYAGNANKVLALNAGATDVEWLTLSGTGTVTSVNLTAGTGISVSGGPITTSGSITVVNTAPDQVVSLTGAGTTVVTGTYPNFTITSNDASLGTVTSVSVVTANGLSGSVATSTTTPAITLTTTVTGVVKGNGTALSAASAGTDYVAPGAYTTSGLTMATARLLGRTTASSGAAEEITVGTGLSLSAGSLTNSAPDQVVSLTGGTAISISGTYPSFTVTNSAPDQVVSLTGAGTTVVTGAYPNFTITSNDSTVGTVTSVSGTGTVSGLTLTGTVTTSGSLTLGGTLAVVPSDFASQTANTFLAAPNGAPGAPTFRAIVAADVPTLNQNTTGTAANVTGIVAVANGGTGLSSTPANGAIDIGNGTGFTRTTLTAGTNVSITNGAGAITINATDQFVGTVTSVSGTGTVNGITLTGTVTSSGSLTLGGTLSGVSLTTQVSGTLPVANGGTNATATPTAGAVAYGTGTAYAFTGAGTAGQVLVSTGASAPAFSGIDGGTF